MISTLAVAASWLRNYPRNPMENPMENFLLVEKTCRTSRITRSLWSLWSLYHTSKHFKSVLDNLAPFSCSQETHCQSFEWQLSAGQSNIASGRRKMAESHSLVKLGLSIVMGVPQNGWFIRGKPIKMYDLGVPWGTYFRKPP